jgi:prepilin-type N-terminal cleavage/methylation domain-containing protein
MKRAFTLVELVVVLVVVALVTHLAVRELAHVQDARREAAADRLLEDIRDSIWSVDADGEPSGFLADMGRMPRALDELWRKPAGARDFAVTNVVPGVHVPGGWRGPYLRLPLARTELLDPWGNAMRETDDAGLRRVWKDSNGFITNVCHYGASAQARGRRDMPLEPVPSAASRLVVYVDKDVDGSTCHAYEPADGDVKDLPAAETDAQSLVFEGLTPGVRILKLGTVIRRLVVKPGDNTCSIAL